MWLLLPILFWLIYFFIGLFLFFLNFYIFRKFSGLDIDREVLEDHNTSLASIIRWQFIWQAIMIWSLIYFFWTTLDKIFVDGVFLINNFLLNIADLLAFWFIWIFMFQVTIFVIWKFISLEKEIVIEQNESLWKIIEWILIAMSIILSLSIYAY